MNVDVRAMGVPPAAVAHQDHDLHVILKFAERVSESRLARGGEHAELAGMHAEANIAFTGEASCLRKAGFDQVPQVPVAIESLAARMGVTRKDRAHQPVQTLHRRSARHVLDLRAHRG